MNILQRSGPAGRLRNKARKDAYRHLRRKNASTMNKRLPEADASEPFRCCGFLKAAYYRFTFATLIGPPQRIARGVVTETIYLSPGGATGNTGINGNSAG